MENSILLGDCFELMAQIPSGSIDLILTDPPYAISKNSNFKTGDNPKFNIVTNDFGNWDHQEIDLGLFISESHRILKKGGTLITFYDIWKSTKVKQAAESVGFKQPRVGQWVKTNPTPINSKLNYLSNAIEFFFTFVKDKKPTYHSVYDKGIYNYPLTHGKVKTTHPTQKPLGLFEALIQKHSNPNDLILDPFAGSGTTGEACKNLHRRYILIEKSEEYYNIIKNRLHL